METFDFGYLYGSSSFLPSISYFYSKYAFFNGTLINPRLNSLLAGQFSSIPTSGNGLVGTPQPQKCLSIDLYNSFYTFYCYEPFHEKIDLFSYSNPDKPWISMKFYLEYRETESDETKELSQEETYERKRMLCKCSLTGYELVVNKMDIYIYIDKDYKYGQLPDIPLLSSVKRIYTEYVKEPDSHTKWHFPKLNRDYYNGIYNLNNIDDYVYDKVKLPRDTNGIKAAEQHLLLNNKVKSEFNAEAYDNLDKSIQDYRREHNLDLKTTRKEEELKSNELQVKKDYGKYSNENSKGKEHIKDKDIWQSSKKEYESKDANRFKTSSNNSNTISISMSHSNYKNYTHLKDIRDNKILDKNLLELRNEKFESNKLETDEGYALGFRIKLPLSLKFSAAPIYRYVRSWKQAGSLQCDWSKFELLSYLQSLASDKDLVSRSVMLVYNNYALKLDTNLSDYKERSKAEYYNKVFKWNIYKLIKWMETNHKCLYIIDSSEYLKKLYRNTQKFNFSEEDLEKLG